MDANGCELERISRISDKEHGAGSMEHAGRCTELVEVSMETGKSK